MASLLPLIQELLPMILPSSIHIAKAEEIRTPSPSRLHEEDALALGVENEQDGKLRQRGLPWPTRDGHPESADGLNEANAHENATREGAEGNLGRRHRTSEFELDDDEGYGYGNEEDYGSEEEAPVWSRKRGMGQISTDYMERGREQNGGRQGGRSQGGVTMNDAIVNKTGRMCASVLTVKPKCSTIVFHNGEQEVIMYAVSGQAVLATEDDDADYNDEEDTGAIATPGTPPSRRIIGPGDFAFVPAWTEHQVINESDAIDVVWVVVHSGAEPTVVPLREWGGPEARF